MSGHAALSSQASFNEWPPALRTLFGGALTDAPKGFTASLCATDSEGRVRTALLSVGELLVPDAITLCFALWPASRTAQAIAASGRASLSFVFAETFYQVHFDVQRIALEGVPLTCFVGTMESGEGQRVPYARLTSGITFELLDAETVNARWSEQMGWLKRIASAAAGYRAAAPRT